MKKRIMRVAILLTLLAGMLTVSAEATSSWTTQDWARHFNPLYFDQCDKAGNVRWALTVTNSEFGDSVVFFLDGGVIQNPNVDVNGTVTKPAYAAAKSAAFFNDNVTIGTKAFYYCESLTSVTIPKGCTSIGTSAFHGCTGLTSITIPEGVTSIGDLAFCNCEKLTSITIPEGCTSIGTSAFRMCRGLTSITIPASVTSIGDSAFLYDLNLKNVYYAGSEEQWNQINIIGTNYLKNATKHYATTDQTILSGWFADEAFTTPSGENDKNYAKYVDKNILTVKWQISGGTTATSASTNLRLFTSVDSLNYKNVGFVVKIGDGEEKTYTSSNVYTQISSWNGETIKPTVFSPASQYFYAYRFDNIPQEDFNTSITVTPFWTTLDGTRVTGTTRTFKISDDWSNT